MSSCPDLTTLNDLVDDELEPGARERVEAHVAGCAACADHVRGLVDVIDRASRLPRTIAPPHDLWPSIRHEARGEVGRPAARRSGSGVRWLAAAAAVAVLVAGGLALDAARRAGSGAAGAAAPAASAAVGDDELDRLAAEYADASRRLLEALDRRGDALPAVERAELDRNLAAIDGAIEAVRAGIDGGAEGPGSRRALHALYRQKVDVLWRAARLAS